jgi:DNA-binding response OmpR family regulator
MLADGFHPIRQSFISNSPPKPPTLDKFVISILSKVNGRRAAAAENLQRTRQSSQDCQRLINLQQNVTMTSDMAFRTPEFSQNYSHLEMRSNLMAVEDEAAMAELLQRGLEDQHYRVTLAKDGVQGLEAAKNGNYTAIILDVALPLLDGYSVASLLRAGGVSTPILMLTARDSVEDVISGLDAGAEDYMTKPFSFLELLARVRALVRRHLKQIPDRMLIGDLALNITTREVTRGGSNVPLTKTEYLLLQVLMQNPGHVVLRQEIIRTVWGCSDAIESASLDVFVKSLRSKIDRAPSKKLIHTVRGFGYKIAEF